LIWATCSRGTRGEKARMRLPQYSLEVHGLQKNKTSKNLLSREFAELKESLYDPAFPGVRKARRAAYPSSTMAKPRAIQSKLGCRSVKGRGSA
jgi:hypothetical protein